MSLGQIAYDAYCEKREWKAYNGQTLPPWGEQEEPLQVAWEAAARAVVDRLLPKDED